MLSFARATGLWNGAVLFTEKSTTLPKTEKGAPAARVYTRTIKRMLCPLEYWEMRQADRLLYDTLSPASLVSFALALRVAVGVRLPTLGPSSSGVPLLLQLSCVPD